MVPENNKKQTNFLLIDADAVDPDNPVLTALAGLLFPEHKIRLLLSGRPVDETVTKEKFPKPCAEWFQEGNPARSRQLQVRNAARFVAFCERFGVELRVYDGGIAPKTLVPHWVHKDETVIFGDTPEDAETNSRLRTRQELADEIMAAENPVIYLITGGPETGNHLFFTEHPECMPFVQEEIGMLANWGAGSLMDLGGGRCTLQQFNVACDPIAARWSLIEAPWPVLLVTTETTKQPDICFGSLDALRAALPDTDVAAAIVDLYKVWWDTANLANRGGIIIYDLAPLFALDEILRDQIFQVTRVSIDQVTDKGEVYMTPTDVMTNRWATQPELQPDGAELYLRTFHNLCL